jgi:hypothetical protein
LRRFGPASSRIDFQRKQSKQVHFRTSIHLPRFSPIHEVTGKLANSARHARELAALEAVKLLHKVGELDNSLRPSLNKKIAEYVAMASSESWLEARVAGDRILQSNWDSLQTWRKPPYMRLEQNVPLSLDYRAVGDAEGRNRGCSPSTDLQQPDKDVLCRTEGIKPTGDPNCVSDRSQEAQQQINEREYWIYCFHIASVADRGQEGTCCGLHFAVSKIYCLILIPKCERSTFTSRRFVIGHYTATAIA